MALSSSPPARAVELSACRDAVFAVGGATLVGDGAASGADKVMMHAGTVALDSGCPAAPASIKTTRRGTLIRAEWDACGAAGERVRLRARVTRDCSRIVGVVVTGPNQHKRRFTGHPCPDASACPLRCASNADCGATQYCAKEAGQCDASGLCIGRPSRMPLPIALVVCGCDGITYAHGWDAALAGVNIRHRGACGTRCGTIAGIPCPEGQFCELEPGMCSSADLEGECVEQPSACTREYVPVCGCDGHTYGNDCERRRAGVQKAHDGPCGECHTACDCADRPFSQDCPLLCPSCGNYWLCERAQCVEHCGPMPPGTCQEQCRTACDCAGRAFSNPCLLECATCDNYWTCAHGQCVEQCGPVPPDMCGERCGTILGLPCPPGEFCELPAGMCNTADLEGRCVTVGDACITLLDPVCGCDGNTYGNDCERVRAGVQQAHHGPCKDGDGSVH